MTKNRFGITNAREQKTERLLFDAMDTQTLIGTRTYIHHNYSGTVEEPAAIGAYITTLHQHPYECTSNTRNAHAAKGMLRK